MSEDSAFRVVSIFYEETISIAGGSLQWVPLRRRLGIRAFGTNAYRAALAGDRVVEEHVESPGQEELYVILSGAARFSVDGQQRDVPAGSAVFVARPEVRRGATALADETVVLAVGGWPNRAYHSLPWEPIYLAQDAIARGDWATAAETLEREAGEQRGSWIVRFRLACCLAQLGEHDRARDELREAIDANPDLRERAEVEALLAPLREPPNQPA